ncbi:hypothetical protein BDV98DRAFT_576603 [Pterulicium gracile]|uniref:Uncharacterized protein n=1 Tax=Pterulicium gracile TaxID=1884261 RepID=A0A5C3Q1X7_9AGAR|nr:hypothetical protein BDV98DRAFT_576603 [Pterula gracilis]
MARTVRRPCYLLPDEQHLNTSAYISHLTSPSSLIDTRRTAEPTELRLPHPSSRYISLSSSGAHIPPCPHSLCSIFIVFFPLCLYLSAVTALAKCHDHNNVQHPKFTSVFPSSLCSCQDLTIAWEGGVAPFVIGVFIFRTLNNDNDDWKVVAGDVNAHEYTINVDRRGPAYPSYSTSTIASTITNADTTRHCHNHANKYYHREAFTPSNNAYDQILGV